MPCTFLVYDRYASEYADDLRVRVPEADVIAATTFEQASEAIEAADGIAAFSSLLTDELLVRGKRLRWLQTLSSGVDFPASAKSVPKNLLVTSCRGVAGPFVAEMAFTLMLALSRQLPFLIKQQQSATWDRRTGRTLFGKTAGILGLGAIGEQIARRCKSFGMRVVGFGSNHRAEEYLDAFHLYSELNATVGYIDYLILCLPSRPGTENLVNASVFGKMKPTSILVNVGRGTTLNEADLFAALMEGRIGGAGLDVFVVEPLPSSSPFWTLGNVIVSPHVGGVIEDYAVHALGILEQNLKAFCRGKTGEFVNVATPMWRS